MQMGCGERVKIAWKMCVRFYKIRSGGKECPCHDLTLQLNIRLRNFSTSCLFPKWENGTRVVHTETLSNTLSMLRGNGSLSKNESRDFTEQVFPKNLPLQSREQLTHEDEEYICWVVV
jgi:hypothetical protein